MATKRHIPRIYINEPISVGGLVQLPPDKAHHVIRVLRASEGAAVTLFNGRGGEYLGTLAKVNKGVATIEVQTHVEVDRESPLSIHLLMGVCKRDAMSAALKRATELGVAAITPLITEFSDVSAKQLPALRPKWLNTIENAAEQSGRTQLPTLHEAQPFAGLLEKNRDSESQAFIAHPSAEHPSSLAILTTSFKQCLIAIGPEGGFSDRELDQARTAGFAPLSLGPRILRAETAPAAALAILQYLAGDL